MTNLMIISNVDVQKYRTVFILFVLVLVYVLDLSILSNDSTNL